MLGFAAATASHQLRVLRRRLSGAEIVAGVEPYGFGIEVDAPWSLRNTIASSLPLAAAAASAMSPFSREYAKRKLAGPPSWCC